MTSLPDHLHKAFVAKLKEPQFDGMAEDAAFTKLTADKNFCGLRTLSFVTAEKMAALRKGLL